MLGKIKDNLAPNISKQLLNKSGVVAIIGFGYIGSSIGAFLLNAGYKVLGVDPAANKIIANILSEEPFEEPSVQEHLQEGLATNKLEITTDFKGVEDAVVVLVTVGTPLTEDNRANTVCLVDALGSVAPLIHSEQLVVLKSTVPPGTTEGMVMDILYPNEVTKQKALLAFCPERVAQSNVLEELGKLDVVLGGVNENSTQMAQFFYETVFNVRVVSLENPRAAELVKLANNAWIDINIALANELAKVSDVLNVDVLEVIMAANSLKKGSGNVNILTPSVGIGGSCLTKDPWFLDDIGKKHQLGLQLPQAARAINDAMPKFSVDLLINELKKLGKDLPLSKIAILGAAFKSNTGDCRNSPVLEVFSILKNAGASICVYDPLVKSEDMKNHFGQSAAQELQEVIASADCVMFLTGHEPFHQIVFKDWIGKVADNTIIFDGRMYFTQTQIAQFKNWGWRYKGIGR